VGINAPGKGAAILDGRTADCDVQRADGGLNILINSAQYDPWRANFGNTVNSGSRKDLGGAVLEPESIALVVLD